MKLAFIVQRYGRDILGGAETLVRQIAERLARRHEIEVLTTTARDYVTWRNEYPAGEEKLRGVRIIRFPVEQERNLEEFNRFSDWIYDNPHSRDDELKWLAMQGPLVPSLVEHLKREQERYDLLVFFTYLYYPTYYGIQIAPEKSMLIPTAHDEPPLKLEIYKDVFESASSLVFNSEAEELLVLERFPVHKKMRETIGMGMELLDQPNTAMVRKRHKLPGRFLLYAGRIDAGKGCDELIRYFRLYRDEHPEHEDLQLVLIGKLSMALPSMKEIRYLGFLDEEEKLATMAAANAVVVPSRFESLSIVVLEAFSVGTPVIVNAGARVLVDHCRQSNGGLYYGDYEEFEAILDLVLGDKNFARTLGRQGQRYIKKNFGWDRLLPRYELAFRSSARAPRPGLEAPRPEAGPAERSAPAETPERPDRVEAGAAGSVPRISPAGEEEGPRESENEAASPTRSEAPAPEEPAGEAPQEARPAEVGDPSSDPAEEDRPQGEAEGRSEGERPD